jgi:FMN-dependent NADH-azoreductase
VNIGINGEEISSIATKTKEIDNKRLREFFNLDEIVLLIIFPLYNFLGIVNPF